MEERADVEDLARAQRLVTRELSPFNAFYGHADLLRRYAGIPGSRPLKAAVEHGPTLVPNPDDPDLATLLPRYFCSASGQASFFNEHALHGARAIAIGAPILYARALSSPLPLPGRRLLFFDAHSSDYATARYDVAASAERLLELAAEFDEVVVCLYWRDVLLGRADLYRQHGLRCVTAGHMFDPRYLFRLTEIISSAAVVLTDYLGSHFLYALALDRPAWLEHSAVEYELSSDAPPGTLGPVREGVVFDRATALFSRLSERIDADQRAFADELCGTADFRSPTELGELIGEAEAAYRAEAPLRWKVRLEATAAARYLWNAARW